MHASWCGGLFQCAWYQLIWVVIGQSVSYVFAPVVLADVGVTSLVNVKSQCIGETGRKGQSKHCHGANADNTVVHVRASNLLIVWLPYRK